MTVDEFLAWGAAQESGRYELEDGAVLAMSPERAGHWKTKLAAAIALRDAVIKAGLPCHAVPDGATVRIRDRTAYEPDALVYCGEEVPRNALEVSNPIIIAEVVSPATAMRDVQAKLQGYFGLASLHHYLIMNPETLMVTHHSRMERNEMRTRIVSDGVLDLDQPGLQLNVASLFA
jgi:Uma2 family endonuclease